MATELDYKDGQINIYNLGNSGATLPRVYFVNGIRVLSKEHAVAASYLSLLLERPIVGVYNKTAGKIAGFVFDMLQSGADYLQNATARPFSPGNLNKPAKLTEEQIPEFLRTFRQKYTIWNQATASLFEDLLRNRHEWRHIIAHSQGNLITSNALFILEDLLGSAGLQKIRVYSLASPSPAWPVGLSYVNGGGGRQDNAFMNDLVALLRPQNLTAKIGLPGWQNKGDFRSMPGVPQSVDPKLRPHDMFELVETMNFLKSIRKDLHMNPELTEEFLNKCRATAEKALAQYH